MSRHSTSSSHGTNDPAIGHSMDSDSMSFNTQYPNSCPSIVSHAGMTQDVLDNPNKPSFNKKSTLSPKRTQLETCLSHPLPDKAIRPSQKRRQPGQSNTARKRRYSLWNRANTSDAMPTYENQCKTRVIQPSTPMVQLPQSPAHSDEECQAKKGVISIDHQHSKEWLNLPARRISTWCEHHKVNTHSTSECRLTNPSSTNATSSRVFLRAC
ncbi:hypothetical protein BASA83_013502 [Batrachochytrium salamandrivorans]|nr:hypothetical protein BASA83_013502 [Batrachochytrium salamandrivorans]